MCIVTSGDVVDFLSLRAPRPWVKRMLVGMICRGEILAYYNIDDSNVTTTPRRAIKCVAQEGESFEFIRQNYKNFFGQRIAEKFLTLDLDDSVRIQSDDVMERQSFAMPLSPEIVFLSGGGCDLDRGIVSLEIFDYENWPYRNLIGYVPIVDVIKCGNFNIRLSGICFDKNQVEMLCPEQEIASKKSQALENPDEQRRIGRPRRWDWDEVNAHLIAIAQTPDGLPSGSGSQAEIERIVANWFEQAVGDSPSISLIRQHVSRIVRTIKTPESR